jgi:hypothetical protein
MSTVLDYSNWRPPSAQALKNAGVVGVMRYIAPAAWAWPKAITTHELTDLHSAGLQVGFNFEKNPGDWNSGYTGGTQNGVAAATAMKELGIPTSIPVFFSYDEEIAPGSFPAVANYHRGCRDAMQGRPADAYGEGALTEYLAGQGLLVRGWQSESTSFPGNSVTQPHTVLVQHYGQQVPGLAGDYDVNTIIKTDWGQYPSPVSPPQEDEKLSDMSEATNHDGRPLVFQVGHDKKLYFRIRDATGGNWSAWNDLSGGMTNFESVSAWTNADTKKVEVWVTTATGTFQRYQTDDFANWTAWGNRTT